MFAAFSGVFAVQEHPANLLICFACAANESEKEQNACCVKYDSYEDYEEGLHGYECDNRSDLVFITRSWGGMFWMTHSWASKKGEKVMFPSLPRESTTAEIQQAGSERNSAFRVISSRERATMENVAQRLDSSRSGIW